MNVILSILLCFNIIYYCQISAESPKQKDKSKLLAAKVKRIRFNSERYVSWWMGHETQSTYNPFKYAQYNQVLHNATSSAAIFTSIFHINPKFHQHNCDNINECFSTYFGSLRKVFAYDIVVAVPHNLDISLQDILITYKIITYEIPKSLCLFHVRDSSIFCGTEESVIPATLFRYYFYELWSLKYHKTMIMISEFDKETSFTRDPFMKALLFLETNQMVFISSTKKEQAFNTSVTSSAMSAQAIGLNPFSTGFLDKCYNTQEFKSAVSNRKVIDTSVVIGTRDGMVVWTHAITMQMQEMLERVDDLASKGCLIDNVEKVFMQYLIYSNRLRKYLRIKIYHPNNNAANNIMPS